MKRNQTCSTRVLPYKIPQIRLSIVLITILFIINVYKGYTQNNQPPRSLAAGQPVADSTLISEIPREGLQVGDPIPENVWNLPLKLVNHPDGKKHMVLNDFKNRLLILDFGATYCPPCIRSIHKLDTLEQKIGGQFKFLPVTTEPTERIKAFVEKSGWEHPFITEASSLTKLFPHHTTPHLVWIWNGAVVAITESYYATDANIQAVLEGKKMNLPEKREWLNFKTTDPWVVDERFGEALLYESAIAGYIPGGWPLSEIGQGNEVNLVNLGVYGLYIEVISVLNPTLRTPNRVLLEMSDSLRRKVALPKEYRSNDRKKDEWRQTNGYSYHLKVPDGFSQETIGQIALEDLNSFFGNTLNITGRIEKRRVKCLALVRTNDQDDLLQTKYPGRKSVNFGDDGNPLTRNVPFDGLVRSVSYCLNELPTPVIDRTGYEGNVDYDLHLERENVETVRRELQRYGLDLREEVLEINMFVIAERGEI